MANLGQQHWDDRYEALGVSQQSVANSVNDDQGNLQIEKAWYQRLVNILHNFTTKRFNFFSGLFYDEQAQKSLALVYTPQGLNINLLPWLHNNKLSDLHTLFPYSRLLYSPDDDPQRIILPTELIEIFFPRFRTAPTLLASPRHPVSYVIRTLLDQSYFDLSVIQRAFQQREQGSDEEKSTLQIADWFAKDALQFAEGKLIDPTVPITYFQKSASVRVIPYANAALIGIPFSCTTWDADYLAIAHEVGHHVYWHGRIDGVPIPNYLALEFRGYPKWLLKWMEEIFSDVYGTIIAGPVIALRFQDMLLSQLPTHFVYDDGAHPIPLLRSWIYIYALEQLDNLIPDAVIKGLKNHWEYHEKTRALERSSFLSNTDWGLTDSQPHFENVSIDQAKDYLKEIVKKIIEILGKPEEDKLWSKSVNEPINYYAPENMAQLKFQLDQLYKEFPEEENSINYPNETEIQAITDSLEDQLIDFIQGLRGNENIPPHIWLPVFAAGGWTLKGPETEPVVG
ncbi:hypothetical protein [Candidatus Leptofilum sp.]|uniref:hypothetical protein n=1 Tax=Candidatus Leptofilum sp. TaxID=3241576 RepID=UPI003B5AF047